MNIQVKLFAAARELVGAGSLAQECPVGATVQNLVEVLFEAHPELRDMQLQFAVNAVYVRPETALQDGDQVAFIPPVGGG